MNLAEVICQHFAELSRKSALCQVGRTYTFGQLAKRFRRLAAVMHEKGSVDFRGSIMVRSRNSVECVEVLLAAFHLGASVEMCNVRWSSEITALVIDKSVATIAFVELGEPNDTEIIGSLRQKEVLVVTIGGAFPGCVEYETFLATRAVAVAAASVTPQDVALKLFTSGTTNVPKGVLLSVESIATQCRVCICAEAWQHDEVFLSTFPLYHVAGFAMLRALCVGAEVVICRSNRMEDMALLISSYNITRISFAPILLRRLMDFAEQHTVDLSSVRTIMYGSDRMPVDLIERGRAKLHCGFYQGYGATETAGAVSSLLPEHHDDPALLDSVGKPLPGVKIRIVDERGRDCDRSAEGEVIVSAQTLMKGYADNEKLSHEVLKEGWYYTRDMGFFDEAGFLHLCGRKDDMIVSGGENIFPQEVAECLLRLEGVADAAVVGVSDKHWGQTIAAFVVKENDAGLGKNQVVEHCAHHLGRFKKPHYVYFVESLPRGVAGKVLKKELFLLHQKMEQKKQEGSTW